MVFAALVVAFLWLPCCSAVHLLQGLPEHASRALAACAALHAMHGVRDTPVAARSQFQLVHVIAACSDGWCYAGGQGKER
jgi:hypothetical protein